MKKLILSLLLPIVAANAMHAPRKPVISNAMRSLLNTRVPEIVERMFHPRHYKMCGVHPIGMAERTIELPEIPDHIIKHEERPNSRLEGAQKLDDSIHKRKLNLVETPDQEAYQIPLHIKKALSYQVPDQLIVARKIMGEHGKPITLSQARQLKILIGDTYYCDWHPKNIVHTNRNTIGLIDTELRGFNSYDKSIPYCLEALIARGILEPDAKEYLESELRKVKSGIRLTPHA